MPHLDSPMDNLLPQREELVFSAHVVRDAKAIVVDPEGGLTEILKDNNVLEMP